MKSYGGWEFKGRVLTNPDINSTLAAHGFETTAPNVRALIWSVINTVPAACWEIEQRTGLAHETASSTIHYLYHKGAIKRRARNRTPHGNLAWVYVAVPNPDIEE